MRLRATPCPTAPVQMTDSQGAQLATLQESTVMSVSRLHAQTKRAYTCILPFRMGRNFVASYSLCHEDLTTLKIQAGA